MMYSINETARIGATTPNAGLTKNEREVFDMAKVDSITPEALRQLLRYEPETGKLYWKPRPAELFKDKRSHGAWNARYAEKEALTSTDGYGYRRGCVFDRGYQAHRVIWAIHYGEWPDGHIDHINGDPTDNRAANLRPATVSQNLFNKPKYKNNASGFKGVHLDKRTGRWRAQITAYGKRETVGTFNTPEAAHAAYCEAAEKFHGEFARY